MKSQRPHFRRLRSFSNPLRLGVSNTLTVAVTFCHPKCNNSTDNGKRRISVLATKMGVHPVVRNKAVAIQVTSREQFCCLPFVYVTRFLSYGHCLLESHAQWVKDLSLFPTVQVFIAIVSFALPSLKLICQTIRYSVVPYVETTVYGVLMRLHPRQ